MERLARNYPFALCSSYFSKPEGGSRKHRPMSVAGPGCVKTSVSRGCRELFFHFRLLAEVASAIEFPHLRNLERRSTRKLNDGVFTRPGSNSEVGPLYRNVRSTLKSGRRRPAPACPKGARSRRYPTYISREPTGLSFDRCDFGTKRRSVSG